MDCRILKLIIQPIIENSIIHGIEKKNGLGEINISGQKIDNKVIFTITDNGIGMTKDKINKIMEFQNVIQFEDNDKIKNLKTDYEIKIVKDDKKDPIENVKNKSKIGIINVIQRIKLNYGNDYGLKIISKRNYGTTVIITIPYIT